ncbi:unnamed protein product [Phytophthora lilii]|uniref:Unnamed protein product n=1 Tax=Phytophthora lilii TaxID=2077276 RepID=A0A9W6YJV6_9STRA|nr:unnamed protein product [Phytophthora lilii]
MCLSTCFVEILLHGVSISFQTDHVSLLTMNNAGDLCKAVVDCVLRSHPDKVNLRLYEGLAVYRDAAKSSVDSDSGAHRALTAVELFDSMLGCVLDAVVLKLCMEAEARLIASPPMQEPRCGNLPWQWKQLRGFFATHLVVSAKVDQEMKTICCIREVIDQDVPFIVLNSSSGMGKTANGVYWRWHASKRPTSIVCFPLIKSAYVPSGDWRSSLKWIPPIKSSPAAGASSITGATATVPPDGTPSSTSLTLSLAMGTVTREATRVPSPRLQRNLLRFFHFAQLFAMAAERESGRLASGSETPTSDSVTHAATRWLAAMNDSDASESELPVVVTLRVKRELPSVETMRRRHGLKRESDAMQTPKKRAKRKNRKSTIDIRKEEIARLLNELAALHSRMEELNARAMKPCTPDETPSEAAVANRVLRRAIKKTQLEVTQFHALMSEYSLFFENSVKKVFDILLGYFSSIENCVSEKLGNVTIREDDDNLAPGVTQNRLISTTIGGLRMESNTVYFSHYEEGGSEPGHEHGYGLFVADFIDEDARSSYHPHERIRRDFSAVLELTSYPLQRRTSGTKTVSSSSTDDEEEGRVVVVTRWVHSKVHHPQYNIPLSGWHEMRENTERWIQTLHQTMLERYFAMM